MYVYVHIYIYTLHIYIYIYIYIYIHTHHITILMSNPVFIEHPRVNMSRLAEGLAMRLVSTPGSDSEVGTRELHSDRIRGFSLNLYIYIYICIYIYCIYIYILNVL